MGMFKIAKIMKKDNVIVNQWFQQKSCMYFQTLYDMRKSVKASIIEIIK